MNRTGEHIVGALAAVDVVIGMHGLPGAASLAGEFAGPIGNHLIDVHVRLGAAAALPARQRKFPIQLSRFHLAGRLADPLAALLIEHAELMVGLGGHALEASDRMDQLQRNWVVADLEAMPGPLGLCPPVTLRRDTHIAKAVVLEPPGLTGVAVLIRHKAKKCSDEFLIVHPYH